MPSYQARLVAERRWAGERVAANPDSGKCCVLVKLGTGWVSRSFRVFCSFQAKPGSAFCGQHDHIPEAWGAACVERAGRLSTG